MADVDVDMDVERILKYHKILPGRQWTSESKCQVCGQQLDQVQYSTGGDPAYYEHSLFDCVVALAKRVAELETK